MNQDSSFPPMLPPSTELGALLFAVLPCLQESYRPLASFAYHMTELSKLKSIPSVPPLSGLSGVEALISDKDTMLRSLSFYGRMFRMPLLSTIANLLQALQFYQAYKDILPGLSGLGGGSSDLLSALGGFSPDLFSSFFSGFSGNSASDYGTAPDRDTPAPEPPAPAPEQPLPCESTSDTSADAISVAPQETSGDLFDSLYTFLTPEQKKIYEQLMHTD